jgi:hypothetical protein
VADSTLNKSDQIVAEQRDIQHVVDVKMARQVRRARRRPVRVAIRSRLFPNSTSPNQVKRRSSTLHQCMMRLITAAQASCRIRWR